MPGPSLDNLINEYVDTLPVFPKTVTSGNSAFNYYLLKNRFTDISLFNNERFSKKINKVAQNSVEEHNLWVVANKVNLKAQTSFDSTHPAWYHQSHINRPYLFWSQLKLNAVDFASSPKYIRATATEAQMCFP